MGPFILLLALAASLGVSGCEFTTGFANSRVIAYDLINVETITDPQTGEIVTLSHWRYDDGREVTTTDRFKSDTPVTDRRATSRPSVRISEEP